MSASPAPVLRQPVLVRVAVFLIYVSGFAGITIGILVLLSRYDVAAAQVLPVSLLGAGIILFGLLTIAVASGVARGRRLARLLLTIWLIGQLVLHVVTILSADAWDWSSTIGILVCLLIVVAVWTPPGSHYFRDASQAQADAATPA